MVILQVSRIIAKERVDNYLNILKRIGVPQKDRKKFVISFRRRLFVRSAAIAIIIALCQRYLLLKKGFVESLVTQNLWLSAAVLLIVLIFAAFLFGKKHSERIA